MLRTITLFFLLTVLTLGVPSRLPLSVPQPPPTQEAIVAIPLAGFTIGKLLEKFEEVATRLLQRGESTGNALIAKAGDEIHVATQNLGILLDDQREKLFDDLAVEQRGIFIELNKIIEGVSSLGTTVTNVEELAALDLQDLLNRIPLIESKDFYVRSIGGLTMNYNSGGRTVTLRGLGFGFDDSNRKYEVSISVAGKDVPLTSFVRPDTFTLQFTVPNDSLESLFQEEAVAHAPVLFKTKISKKGSGADWTKVEYGINFNLLLLPKKAGWVTLTEMVKTEAVPAGETKTKTAAREFSSCKPDHPCDWNERVCVNDNERIVGVRYDCGGSQCGFCYSLRGRERKAAMEKLKPVCESEINETIKSLSGPIKKAVENNKAQFIEACAANKTKGMEYFPDYDLEEGGRCARVYRHCDGEKSTTPIYYIDYRELKAGYEPKTQGPFLISYGKELIVELDPRNKDCSFVVSGKVTVTNQDINLDSATAIGATPFRLKGAPKVGDHCRATFELRP